ncbi:PIF1 protein [Hirsutella rhossiliensis]
MHQIASHHSSTVDSGSHQKTTKNNHRDLHNLSQSSSILWLANQLTFSQHFFTLVSFARDDFGDRKFCESPCNRISLSQVSAGKQTDHTMAKPTNEGSSVKQADDRSSPRPAEEDDGPRLPDAVQQRRPKRNRVSLNPKDNHSQLADQLQQLPEALNAWKWSIRFLKLMRDKSKEALDTFTVRDKEACEALEDLLFHVCAHQISLREVLAVPQAGISDLEHVPAWRAVVEKAYIVPEPTEDNMMKLISKITPKEVDSRSMTSNLVYLPDADQQLPTEQRGINSQAMLQSTEPPKAPTQSQSPSGVRKQKGSRHSHHSRRDRRSHHKHRRYLRLDDSSDWNLLLPAAAALEAALALDTLTAAGAPLSLPHRPFKPLRLKRDNMGVFNPNHKDPHKQGLVSLSSGSNVYTDVYLFCERLRMYKDLDSYALSQHYMSFLAGGALQWFMNELSIEQKDRLMKSSVEPIPTPSSRGLKELHGIPYTVSMWNAGEVSLPQWIQRKVSLARQINIEKDYQIIQSIHPLIAVQIATHLSVPTKRTPIDKWVREIEERRPLISAALEFRGRYDERPQGRDRDRNYQSRDRSSDRDRSFRNDSRDRDRSYQRDHYQRDRGLDRRDRSNPSSDSRAKEGERTAPKILSAMSEAAAMRKDASDNKKTAISDDDEASDVGSDASIEEYYVCMTSTPENLGQQGNHQCRKCNRKFLPHTLLCVCSTAPAGGDPSKTFVMHLPGCVSQPKAHSNGEAYKAVEQHNPIPPKKPTLSQEILEPQPLEPPSHDAPFGYSYLRIKIKAAPQDQRPRKLLKSFEHTIEKKPPTPIAGISGSVRCTDWATFSFYAEGKRADGSSAGIAKFTSSAWVTTVEPGALLGNAFLKPYEVVQIGLLDDFGRQKTMVPAGKTMLVPASWKEVPKGRSFAFHSNHPLAAHAPVMFTNTTNQDIIVNRKQRLGQIKECEESGYFAAASWKSALTALTIATAALAPTTSAMTIESAPQSHTSYDLAINSTFHLSDDVIAIADGTFTPEEALFKLIRSFQRQPALVNNKKGAPLQQQQPILLTLPLRPEFQLPEVCTDDGIHIYAQKGSFVTKIKALVEKHAKLWKDSGTAEVEAGHELTVAQRPILRDYETNRSLMKPMTSSTHKDVWNTPVFVVWRTARGETKGRVVIDLRALNKVTMPDSYPLPLQEDIIQELRGAQYITAIDASSFTTNSESNSNIVIVLPSRAIEDWKD